MKILLTGGSGFLGQYIKNELSTFDITTIGRTNADIIADLTKDIYVLPKVDMVIHAAGKAHSYPKNHREIQEFYDVNCKATERLLESLKSQNSIPSSLIFISTVAVYGLETGVNVSENAPLLAIDPYGRSKILAEEMIFSWCQDNNVICTIFRLPLIIGRGPKGNLQAMISEIKKGRYVDIRGKGSTRKSVVHAEDVARVIPFAATIGGIYNLTDGYHPSLDEISARVAVLLKRKVPVSISYPVALIIAKIGDLLGGFFPFNSRRFKKMVSNLTFNDTKARRGLDWNPKPALNAIDWI